MSSTRWPASVKYERLATLTDRLLVEVKAPQQVRESVAAGEARELRLESEIIRLGNNVSALRNPNKIIGHIHRHRGHNLPAWGKIWGRIPFYE